MTNSAKNLQKNIWHYNHLYAETEVNAICAKVRDLENFLADAAVTDTSWHGFWSGHFAKQIQGKRILELGCGNGLNALIMATLGAELVVANDISSESEKIIRQAATCLKIQNIQPLCGNFADFPIPPFSFDLVVGKAFLHHLTHDLEFEYLNKAARVLKLDGSARFQEPAVNSRLLDKLRWVVPVPGRPSILQRKAFSNWKLNDAHPERDNSSHHFSEVGKKFFDVVEITPLASIERFCRLMPRSKFQRAYRRWSHRTEKLLPMWFRLIAARSQLIVYRRPKWTVVSDQ